MEAFFPQTFAPKVQIYERQTMYDAEWMNNCLLVNLGAFLFFVWCLVLMANYSVIHKIFSSLQCVRVQTAAMSIFNFSVLFIIHEQRRIKDPRGPSFQFGASLLPPFLSTCESSTGETWPVWPHAFKAPAVIDKLHWIQVWSWETETCTFKSLVVEFDIYHAINS